MNFINITSQYADQNVMQFCSVRLNPKAVNKIKNPVGLQDEVALQTALSVGDYVSVLKSIWGESDREKRLAFLRREDLKFHPVLPFERAMAEVARNPTMETVALVAMPLLSLGRLRNGMDAECSPDLSIQGPQGEMVMTYNQALHDLIEKKVLDKRELSQEEVRGRLSNTLNLLYELREEVSSLPNPSWLKNYGLAAFGGFLGNQATMRPEGEWNKIRLNFLDNRIRELEEFIKKAGS